MWFFFHLFFLFLFSVPYIRPEHTELNWRETVLVTEWGEQQKPYGKLGRNEFKKYLLLILNSPKMIACAFRQLWVWKAPWNSNRYLLHSSHHVQNTLQDKWVIVYALKRLNKNLCEVGPEGAGNNQELICDNFNNTDISEYFRTRRRVPTQPVRAEKASG